MEGRREEKWEERAGKGMGEEMGWGEGKRGWDEQGRGRGQAKEERIVGDDILVDLS